MSGSAMWAQTDVTSTYLTNADFASGTPITVGTCTYDYNKEENSTEYCNLVEVQGWDIPANGNGCAGGLIAFGSGVWIGGPGYTAPVTNADGETTGNILGLVGVWTGTAQYVQEATLPAGTYTMVLGVYNSVGGTSAFEKNLIGFIENDNTEHLATTTIYEVNKWKYEFITFTLDKETTGKFSLGYKGSDVGSAKAQHLFLSGLTLFEGEVDAEAYEAAKAAVRTQKELIIELTNAETIADGLNELLAKLLKEVIATAKTTAESDGLSTVEYQTALDNLKTAEKKALELNANYIYAKQYVDTNPTLPYASEEKKNAIIAAANNLQTATSIEDLEEKVSAVYSAVRAYYESNAKAEAVSGAEDMTSYIKNNDASDGNNDWEWSGNKNEPRNTESWTDSEGGNEHMYFDGGNWSGSNWTTTMSQTITIPAGKYLLTAKGRAAENTTLTLSVGEASVELPHVGASGNVFDRGWNDGYVEFETKGDGITIKVEASAETIHEWFSVSEFRLVQLEKIAVLMADDSDYASLAAAIESAEANKPGFESGEYAPYNNVEAMSALAAAKKIDPTAEDGNTKEVVENAIAALNAATWTANTSELDPIYDGQFANTEANETSGDIDLPGWTKVQGIRLLLKDEAKDPGLAYTDGKAAVFAWGGTTLTYGEQDGYTLPLAKYDVYELTLKIAGWHDGDLPNYMSVTLDDVAQVLSPTNVAYRINDAENNPFVEVKFYVTPTEDNSILKIYANHHFAIADLSMKKAELLSATVTADGYATFVSDAALDFSDTDIKAYTAKVDEDKVVLTQIDRVPARTPVVLYKEGGATESIPFATETDDASDNQLVRGTGAAVESEAGGKLNYVLDNNDGIGFYRAAGLEVPTDRAYLSVDAPSSEARLSIVFAGEATGIKTVDSAKSAVDSSIYNLSGQRVSKAQKGLYIVGGKKVVIK